MNSFQSRLSVGLILVLVALTVVVIALGGYSLRQLAEQFVASRLEHDLETVLAALSLDGQGRPQVALDRISASFRQPYSGHYYRIETANGVLYSRSLWEAELAVPALRETRRVTQLFITGPQQQQLLLMGRVFRVGDQRVSIAVTEDFTPLETGLRRLLVEFAVLAGLAFVVLLGLQRWIVRRGLIPLEQVRRELPRLAQGDIPQLSVQVPDEVLPLVTELNRLLALMNQRQRRTRQALGNLAHALKTPLTALVQLADQPPPASAQDAGWQDLRGQLATMYRLTQRELKRARIVGGGTPGQRVVFKREINDLVETLRRIYRERALDFELLIPPDSGFPGDRDDMLELLGNLLDNACQWARRTIRLTIVAEAAELRLLIEDDGPGCADDQLALLQQRGARLDESRTGHGLGLAISRDIVAQYQGWLRLSRSKALGGLRAEIGLPCPTGGTF